MTTAEKCTIENKNIPALFSNFLKGKKVIKRHKQSHKYIALGKGMFGLRMNKPLVRQGSQIIAQTQSLFTLKRRLSLK